MRILLVGIGEQYHVGAALRQALEARGYEHAFFDIWPYLAPLTHSFVHKVGFRLLRRRPLTYWALNRDLVRLASQFRPSVMIASKGEFINPRTLMKIKSLSDATLVN